MIIIQILKATPEFALPPSLTVDSNSGDLGMKSSDVVDDDNFHDQDDADDETRQSVCWHQTDIDDKIQSNSKQQPEFVPQSHMQNKTQTQLIWEW